jgi:hypothetical protein
MSRHGFSSLVGIMNVRLPVLLGLITLMTVLDAANARPEPLLPPFPPERESHHPLDVDIKDADLKEAEARLARLRKSLEPKKLDDLIKQIAQKVLADRNLVEKLKKNIKPEMIQKLTKSVQDGKLDGFEPLVRHLLLEHNQVKNLISPEDKEKIRRWVESNPNARKDIKNFLNQQTGPTVPVVKGKEKDPPKKNPPATTKKQPPTTATAKKPAQNKDSGSSSGEDPARRNNPRPLDYLPPESAEWVKRNLEDIIISLGRWSDTPAGQSLQKVLEDIAGRGKGNPTISPELAEQAKNLAQLLPRFDGQLPGGRGREMDLSRAAQEPSLLRLPNWTPSFPTGFHPRSASWSDLILVALLITAGIALTQLGLRVGRVWPTSAEKPLGPWPVLPENVSTGADLVRAFEYLAVLRLGPTARMNNHVSRAANLAALPTLDSEQLDDSVWFLTELYELARYAPENLTLSPELVLRVRRELAYVAGVAAQ